MSALYRELPAPDGLGALVSCVWEHEADEARGRTGSLAERALAAGYAHQAHMYDEVRSLTGTTAVRFLEDGARSDA